MGGKSPALGVPYEVMSPVLPSEEIFLLWRLCLLRKKHSADVLALQINYHSKGSRAHKIIPETEILIVLKCPLWPLFFYQKNAKIILLTRGVKFVDFCVKETPFVVHLKQKGYV